MRRARGYQCFRRHLKRDAIREQDCKIALAFPTYGYHKVWAELLRRGIRTSRSTVYRVLKAEGLLLPMKRRPKARSQSSEPPRPHRVGLVLSADSTL